LIEASFELGVLNALSGISGNGHRRNSPVVSRTPEQVYKVQWKFLCASLRVRSSAVPVQGELGREALDSPRSFFPEVVSIRSDQNCSDLYLGHHLTGIVPGSVHKTDGNILVAVINLGYSFRSEVKLIKMELVPQNDNEANDSGVGNGLEMISDPESCPLTLSTDSDVPAASADSAAVSTDAADQQDDKQDDYKTRFEKYFRGYITKFKGLGSNPLVGKPLPLDDVLYSMVISFIGILLVAVCHYKYLTLVFKMPHSGTPVGMMIGSMGASSGTILKTIVFMVQMFRLFMLWCYM
jgi:hypothetical protein